MIFTSHNIDDIRRYYEGTFIKLKEFGDKLFCMGRPLRDKHGDWEIVLTDSEDVVHSLVLEEGEPYEMSFSLPHRAVFPANGSVYILQRIPAKQYKRGICSDNTKITEVFSGKELPLSFKRLESFITKGTYESVNSALFEKKAPRTVGVALTNRLSFHLPSQSFYVDNQPFATYDRAKNKILPLDGRMYALFVPHLKRAVIPFHEKQPEFS
jgi:hypothetical protein